MPQKQIIYNKINIPSVINYYESFLIFYEITAMQYYIW